MQARETDPNRTPSEAMELFKSGEEVDQCSNIFVHSVEDLCFSFRQVSTEESEPPEASEDCWLLNKQSLSFPIAALAG